MLIRYLLVLFLLFSFIQAQENPPTSFAPQGVIRVGAVAYSPNVVTIFEGIKEYFKKNNQPFDFVLFSNYEAQVNALLGGMIDIAWNGPLAYGYCHIKTNNKCKRLIMRNVDCTFQSVLVVRTDAKINKIQDLAGKTLAVGSTDSPQSGILPYHFLKKQGVDFSKVKLMRLDYDLGKHGDTAASEYEIIEVLKKNKASAGTIAASTWNGLLAQKKVNQKELQVVWTSPKFSHCVFTSLETFDSKLAQRFVDLMLAMDPEDPATKKIMEMEGVQKWLPGQMEGLEAILEAIPDQKLELNK